MNKFTYLIIGGGSTAYAAIQGIRKHDKQGSIAVLSDEKFALYKRPPLSKGLWKDTPLDKIWLKLNDERVTVLVDHRVVDLDPKRKIVKTANGEEFQYKKLLIATGVAPRRLPFSDPDIMYYRQYSDYLKLREMSEKHDRFAVIGAGFVGSEIAAALAMNKKQVVQIEAGAGIGRMVFPPDIVQYLNEYYQAKGVQLHVNQPVKDIEKKEGNHRIILASGQDIVVDGVIAGVGVSPQSQLAEKAGITVSNGIHVNSYLETSQPDIFAAGDVAAFHSPALDKTIRLEHIDNAEHMGQIAGENMAGGNLEYDYLPMFYSDLFDIGYEAVGLIDAQLDTQVIWHEPYKKGVLYYSQDNIIKGILLWNVWDMVDVAREIIKEQKWVNKADLKNLI
ncbi:MAG: NAD(P)/FAD-dependent oxidoreductase [Chloroflexi bacterium]|nr:NAD(P)/FAD-dependent oxidoreductase [Chloroflexota bacterium]